MSLNSQVTREGHEIGRAQAVQAQACRLEADARMNPILLKPNSDTGAQVIVMGKPVGNMDVAGYIGQKARIFETVKEAYDSLSAEVDAMVIEGAGSPAEVNLKHHDIVNMAMARHAQAPVLLVGDIDRGGLFAAFIGTWAVLAEEERARLAGFVINRFRGRRDLLNDAILYTRQHTGLPTMGVIPLIAELGLPEEDSVAFKAGAAEPPPTDAHRIEIAVIDLPHIANFTDFDALALEPDVRVRIVRRREDLGTPDAVVIPGSKNTLGDLRYLHAGGLAEAIMALNRNRKCCIVGICAGLQILGQEIADPYAIESPGESRPGLGLLPVTTVLEREKTLKAASGRHLESGLTLRGYEIHHGASRADGLRPAVVRDDDEAIGYASADGRIFGTYLHGLFDADPFRRWFIDRLRLRRGWAPLERVQRRYDIEPALDRLAEIVRAHLDVPALYKLMGLKR
jgi:cobyric acid synthase CobQ